MPAQQGWHGAFGTLDAAHAQVSRQESARESCAELSRLLILRQPIAGCTRAFHLTFHASPNGRSPAQAQPPANRSWRRDPPLPCAQAMPPSCFSHFFAAESWMMSQLVEATLPGRRWPRRAGAGACGRAAYRSRATRSFRRCDKLVMGCMRRPRRVAYAHCVC